MTLRYFLVLILLLCASSSYSNQANPLNCNDIHEQNSNLENLDKCFIFYCGPQSDKNDVYQTITNALEKHKIKHFDGAKVIEGKEKSPFESTSYPILFVLLENFKEKDLAFSILSYSLKELVELPFNHKKTLADIWSEKSVVAIPEDLKKSVETLTNDFITEYLDSNKKRSHPLEIMLF